MARRLFLCIIIITICAARGEIARAGAGRIMAPYSGKHGLIQHKFDAGYCPGKVAGMVCGAGGLSAQIGAYQTGLLSEYTSPETPLRMDAQELVLTWNAHVPAGTWLQIQFRVRGGRMGWSSWFDMGEWKLAEAAPRNNKDATYGKLHVDILKSPVAFDTVQYRVRFYSHAAGVSPTLRLVSLCFTMPGDEDQQVALSAPSGRAVSLKVPWFSQLRIEDVEDEEMIERGVCAPTSVTMVMNYHGQRVRIKRIGRHAHDPVEDIFGNWAFLCATAGDYGLHAWVQRFSNWQEVRALIESGTPVILSIAYEKGTISAEPDRESNGHLIVARGFTAGGDVIVNDPGTSHRDRGVGYVYPWEELAVAFFGHGGVGIVIQK